MSYLPPRFAVSSCLALCLLAFAAGCRSRLVTEEDKTDSIAAKAEAEAAEAEAVAAENAKAEAEAEVLSLIHI